MCAVAVKKWIVLELYLPLSTPMCILRYLDNAFDYDGLMEEKIADKVKDHSYRVFKKVWARYFHDRCYCHEFCRFGYWDFRRPRGFLSALSHMRPLKNWRPRQPRLFRLRPRIKFRLHFYSGKRGCPHMVVSLPRMKLCFRPRVTTLLVGQRGPNGQF